MPNSQLRFVHPATALATTRKPSPTFLPTEPLFDPLRQLFVAGSNLAHRPFSVSVVHGFGSSQDLLSACSQVPCER
jgi:hypothetical protein